MKAVYATLCRRCDRLIHPGDPIVPTIDDVWIHAHCAPGADDDMGADEAPCVSCGIIRKAHLLGTDGRCMEGCW